MSGVRFEDLEFVNYKNIIDAIGAMESPSRASVAKALAVSKTTVSYVVSDLIEKGIVEFSISIQLMHQAHTIFDALRSYLLFGVQPPSDYLETPITILFDENTAAMMPEKRTET